MKKEYTLRTVDSKGELVKESRLLLEEGSTLIQYAPVGLPVEMVVHMHENMAEMLQHNSKLITVPFGITLQVLQVK